MSEKPDFGDPGIRDGSCPLCGGTQYSVCLQLRPGFAFGSCDRCGLAHVSPRPTPAELKDAYSRFEQSQPPSSFIVRGSDYSAFARDRFDLVTSGRNLAEPLQLLEIGSGYGLFLRLFTKTAWKTVGIEPSVQQVEFCRRELGLTDVHAAMFDEAQLPLCSFDIVCAFHVIEHTGDPLGMLLRARSLVKPDGTLFLATPELGRIRPSITHDFFLRRLLHLTLFTTETLDTLLLRAGFRPVANHKETDRPAETGSMVVEARIASPRERVRPEEAKKAAIFGEGLTRMGDTLRSRFRSWADEGKRIGVYGGGTHTLGLLDLLGPEKKTVHLIFDDDPLKEGLRPAGVPVVPFHPSNFREVDLIVVSSLSAEEAILRKLATTPTHPPAFGIYRDILKQPLERG